MKKTIILLGAAIALAACNRSEVVTTVAPQEIGFKVVSSAATRADAQLEGTLLTKDYSIYASATQKKTDGTIENAAYFKDQQFQTEDATVSASSQYRAWDGTAASPIYWPIGGAVVDFLAYALPTAKHGTPAATYGAEGTDVASIVAFEAWDTYANQVDLLFAANNGLTAAANSAAPFVHMNFDHAQALLIFQVKTNAADAFTINSITIDGLKVKGTFTVDNSRNNLVAAWSALEAVAGEDIIAPGADPAADNLGEAVTATSYAQIGSSLLIPQQPRLNFVVNYTLGGKTMEYTYNEARGTWEMGKKYIYKLDVTLNEIILTEEVADFTEDDLEIPLV